MWLQLNDGVAALASFLGIKLRSALSASRMPALTFISKLLLCNAIHMPSIFKHWLAQRKLKVAIVYLCIHASVA